MNLFLFSVWFQLIWFVAVLGRETYLALLCLLVVLTLLASVWIYSVPGRYLLAVASGGILLDLLNSLTGLFGFATPWIPLWLAALWLGFACYSWQMRQILLRIHPLLTSLLGAAGGSLSYLTGYKLGAVEWLLPTTFTLSVLFAEWFLLTILLTAWLRTRWVRL